MLVPILLLEHCFLLLHEKNDMFGTREVVLRILKKKNRCRITCVVQFWLFRSQGKHTILEDELYFGSIHKFTMCYVKFKVQMQYLCTLA